MTIMVINRYITINYDNYMIWIYYGKFKLFYISSYWGSPIYGIPPFLENHHLLGGKINISETNKQSKRSDRYISINYYNSDR